MSIERKRYKNPPRKKERKIHPLESDIKLDDSGRVDAPGLVDVVRPGHAAREVEGVVVEDLQAVHQVALLVLGREVEVRADIEHALVEPLGLVPRGSCLSVHLQPE